jgi:ASC-1-like (ASCH) protein
MQITDFLIERVINEDIELVDKFYKESIFIDDEMVETFGDVYPEFMEKEWGILSVDSLVR